MLPYLFIKSSYKIWLFTLSLITMLGKSMMNIFRGYDRQLTRMAIYDEKVYWTENKETSLFSIDLSRSLEVTTVLHDIIPLSSIAIWNPEMKGNDKIQSKCLISNTCNLFNWIFTQTLLFPIFFTLSKACIF